ncbi:MAG TPA: hypothetical protein VFG19_07820 [Geobacteraceae bacterium]|nr:hypothetical protein [Geobacteraceae bacterium]
MKRRCLIVGFGILVSVISSWYSAASASTLVSDNFTRSGASDLLTAPFASPSTSTANTYGGLVEVIVSGTGCSAGGYHNDAFYILDWPGYEGKQADPQYYQLNIGWDGTPLYPYVGEARNIDNYITFLEGVGTFSPSSTIPYDSINHTYHFVVNVPDNAGHLAFGVSDGNFSDNGGEYSIEVYQVGKVSNVPLPSAILLLANGLTGIFALKFRRSRI